MRLGFDPIKQYAAAISLLSATSAADLQEKDPDAPVIVAGEVISVRPILTRKGRSMAQIEIEDATGSVRGVVFPEAFEKFGSLLAEDAILFLLGKVDRTTERVGLRIDEAIPAADALSRLTESVALQLRRSETDSRRLKDIRSTCERHAGDCPVYVEITMPDGKRVLIRTGEHMRVRLSNEFVEAAVHLLGEGSLKLAVRGANANSSQNRRRWRRKSEN